MTVAVITLAIALATVVVSFLTLGIWMIRRDGARADAATRVEIDLARESMARAKAEELVVQLRDQNDEERRRYQNQLAEKEQHFLAFRDKVVAQAAKPELQGMLTDLLTKPSSGKTPIPSPAKTPVPTGKTPLPSIMKKDVPK